MCREICAYLPLLFNEGHAYYPLIKDIVEVHQQIDKAYDNMV
jgi:hypothetical protein